MLRIISRRVKVLPVLALIIAVWCGLAAAVDLFPEDAGREKIAPLYNNLSQNINEEARLYVEYSDYRENLHLKAFWEQLKKLNLSRDEIIQTIAFLEMEMEDRNPGSAYETSSSLPVTSGPEYLFALFSHWRPFYLLISGGFLVLNAFLLVMAVCITCRRNVIALLTDSFKSLLSHDIAPMEKTEHRKAA